MTRHPVISLTAIFALPVFLSSCATLLNGPAINIHIATDEKIKRVSVDNALYSNNIAREPMDPGAYLVRRGHETLVIHAQLDSGEKIIRTHPHLSAAFWLNIENYGVGMLVDLNNPKRYGYRRWYYLALKNTAITLRRFAPVTSRRYFQRIAHTPSVTNIISLRVSPGDGRCKVRSSHDKGDGQFSHTA
jgi:hypothetical protein